MRAALAMRMQPPRAAGGAPRDVPAELRHFIQEQDAVMPRLILTRSGTDRPYERDVRDRVMRCRGRDVPV